MKTMDITAQPLEVAHHTTNRRQHDRRRMSSWRVLGATVAGFPAFLWQLSKNRNS